MLRIGDKIIVSEHPYLNSIFVYMIKKFSKDKKYVFVDRQGMNGRWVSVYKIKKLGE